MDEVVKETCLGIEQRYQVEFLEIGTDKDDVHFEAMIGAYVKKQGNEYHKLHSDYPLALF